MEKRNIFLRILVAFIVLSSLAQYTYAQKLYMFIVYQNDESVGCFEDKATMLKLSEEIKEAVPSLEVVTKTFLGSEMSKSKIQSELNNISVGSNDVIWYYYTGHGENYNTWPISDEREVPITWVFNKVKAKGARLSLTQYDCCNWRSPQVSAPSDIRPKSSFKYLFLEAKGHIIASSCSSGQFSYGKEGRGSVYTNEFYDAIHEGLKWDQVLNLTKSGVQTWASGVGKTQTPQYDWHGAGHMDIDPAPKIKVRNGDTWSSIVREWNDMDGNENKQITVQELKNWNRGKSLTRGTVLVIHK